MARALSLPADRDEFTSSILSSYRVKQGVLHNPRSDRRTTQGIFHIAEGGLPIPDDKLAVPKAVFGKMLTLALTPPRELLRLPFTASQSPAAECFVSLLLRPLVCPEVPGYSLEKTMEIRFFAPGSLVSNLDSSEPSWQCERPEPARERCGLDVEHWTGTPGSSSRSASDQDDQKGGWLPHWDRHRTPAPGWNVLAGTIGIYNNARPQAHFRDENWRYCYTHCGQLFWLLQEGGQNQISYAATLRIVRGKNHAEVRWFFPATIWAREFSANIHVKSMGHS